jgi:predicted cupin superfamily sugar epimerase
MKPVDLIAHPEGGRFREVFRSANIVHTMGGSVRSALTHIYFSLLPGEVSRFHRVASDEIWNLYQGPGLNLYLWGGSGTRPQCISLSADGNCFCHVVPAGVWQAAEPAGDAVLVGCSVAPGFEFSDFQLMDAESDDADRLVAAAPEMARLIYPGAGVNCPPTTDGSYRSGK